MLRKLILAFLRCFIVLGAAFLCLEIAIWLHPPVGVGALAVWRRPPMCSAADLYRGAEQRLRQREAYKRMTEQSRRVERDSSGLELWETPRGRWWVPSGNPHVLPVLLAQQESGIYRGTDRGVRPGDVVLDCGAHIGLYVQEALRAGARLVVAIEPAPVNLECLRRNLRAEIAQGRVLVVPKGVWDKEGVLPLYEDPSNSAADSFVFPMAKYKVAHQAPLTTIDRLVEELRLPRVDLIKMDIKGATGRALQGAAGTLARHHPQVILATEESVDDPKELFDLVAGMNFGYQVRCGSCSVMPGLTVTTDVLLFR